MKDLPLLIKLFLCLALCIVIPVMIVSAITNYTMLNYTENEIGKSGIGKLKVAKSSSELLADYIKRDILRLSLNSDLNELGDIHQYAAALKDIRQLSYISRTLGSLSETIRTNNIYHSLYVYLNNTDYILSSTFSEPESVICKSDYRDADWLKYYTDFQKYKTNLSWLKTRIPKYNRTYIPGELRKKQNESLYNYVITYIYPLTPYTTKLQGAIVVNLYEDALSKLVNSNNTQSEGSIFIITRGGDVISHKDKSLVSRNIRKLNFISSIMKRRSTEGFLVSKIENKRSLVTYLKTDFNNWIYVGVFPLNNLMGAVTALRFQTMGIVLILVVAGIGLSFLISRKIYLPVENLVQQIKRRGLKLDQNHPNEMSFISNAFDTIINEEEHLSDALAKNQRNIREHYLLGLLRGDYTGENSGDGVEDETLSFIHVVCALITIDQYRKFRSNHSETEQTNMKSYILKVMEEICGDSFQYIGLSLERERMALVLSWREEQLNWREKMEESFRKIQTEISNALNLSLSVGIGLCHEGKTGIKLSYNEAQEEIKHKMMAGYGQIGFWQTSNQQQTNYYYPLALEKHILNHLSLGHQEHIVKAVDDLFREIKSKPDLSYDNINQIFNQFLGNIVKYLVESHIKISAVFGENYNIYQDLASQETLDEIREWLIHICTRIFEYRQIPKAKGKNHIANILDYIHQNYHQDIDINTLAEYVGLSYSHVRKIFYDETGENIVNYINNLRINEAKQMLRQSNLSINEIAANLGYNNRQSFTRFFKKYEGITPGDYRNLNVAEN
jgi:YesN/AraC family two-component response regulator